MRRLYVLIDKSLEPVYGCVQGGHAVAQYLIEHSTRNWKNEYLIYVYADIHKWMEKLTFLGEDFSYFREPDLKNVITAIAIESDGKIFRHLKLVS